jgi:hypothetical protein
MGGCLVVLRTFTTLAEATVVRSAFEAFGIECALSTDESAGQRRIFTQGVQLFVRTGDEDKAKDVLSRRE